MAERTGRHALAEALSEVIGSDLDDVFMASVDAVLARLWMHGYAVLPIPEEQETVDA